MAIQKVTDGLTIVQSAGTTYEGNSANQTYSLNPALITAGQTITIVDQGGSNKIELVGGLTITNSIVTSNETQFTLSNGAVVNVRGADTFTFAIGQNTAAGDTIGSNLTFSQFATQILGVTLPAAGAAAVTTTTTSVINTDGTATIGGTTTTTPTFSVTAATPVTEGSSATFTITLSSAQTSATSVAYTLAGTGGATLGTDTTTVPDATLTFAAGETTKTVTVPVTSDTTTETGEGVSLTLSSASTGTALSSTASTATVAISDAAAVVGTTFSLTTGVDNITGTDKADVFNGALTTVGNLDSLDGKAGKDIANLEVSQDISSTFTTTDVETINLTTYGARNVDMTKMTGVETFNVKNSTGKVTITNANSATMALSFEGSSTNDIKAGYKAGTLSGTADKLAVSLNTASAVKVETDAGFESAEITVNGKSDIDQFTAAGVTTVALKGSGNLDIANGQMTGIETLSAADYTGSLTTGTADATTGFVPADAITGSANGTVITLGSGTDNISVKDVSAANKSTTVKLGAGDDKVTVNAAGNAIYVFGEAGNDSINAVTTALDSADVINGGEGTDTLTLNGNLANNAMVLKSIEKVTIDGVAGAGAAQTFTNDDDATAITYKVDNSTVNLANLTAGSTVTVETKTGATTKTAGAVTVGFEEVEAANTIEVKSGMTGALTTSKITNVTANLGAASDIATAYSFTAATDVTINATGALSTTTGQNVVDSAATDTLKNFTATGSDLVKFGTITSTVMENVNVTAAKALTVGNIGADSEKLDSVTLTATAGALAMGNIGKTTGTNTLDVTINAKDAITVTGGAIESTKIGNISATSTAGAVTLGAIGSTATQIGDITVNAKGNVSVGLIGHATEVATSVGTISMTSTDGYIYAANINTKDADGITVNMTAKTTIDKSNGSTQAIVENVGGNITASLAGAAAAYVDYTGKVVNLTATNTGGLKSTITNAATAGDSSTSTISLGNAASGKTNAITIDGTVDTINVTGGTGTDTVAFGGADAIKNGTISLGGGSSDSIDFSGLAITNTKGLAMNFSSSTIYFGEGNANVSSIASGKVAAYDAANYAGSTTAANKAIIVDGQNFTVSGVEIVVGTDAADYISVANTGMTVTGGAGADIIIANAGVDTIKMSATGETYSGASIVSGTTALTGIDKVYGIASGDKIDLSAILNTFTGAAATDAIASASGTTVALIQGKLAANGVWTSGTTAGTHTDTLFVYDADGAGAGTALEAIALVGVVATGTADAGVLTLA